MHSSFRIVSSGLASASEAGVWLLVCLKDIVAPRTEQKQAILETACKIYIMVVPVVFSI
jgi:hypothetical protein